MGNNPSVEYNAHGEATYAGPESGALGAVGIVFVKDRQSELATTDPNPSYPNYRFSLPKYHTQTTVSASEAFRFEASGLIHVRFCDVRLQTN